jgi:(1->4)-alpha-D-glucan 1-alpha-D-glucosylmutase
MRTAGKGGGAAGDPLGEAIERVRAAGPRIPSATYRLQLGSQLTFRDAQALVPYLHDLGISDCYISPILKPRPGSTHGYDVCDHSQLNPALGSEADFAGFISALQRYDMGLILDVVPNHMAIGHPSNLWWRDVLENGPASDYATYFDINWSPVNPQLKNKVLLPILEDQYGKVLESGKIQLAYEDGAFSVHYYETILPVAPDSYGLILGHRLATLAASLGDEHEHVQELQSILTALSHLPSYTEAAVPERSAERSREKEIIKRRIAALAGASPAIADAIAETVRTCNGDVGNPASFDLLDDLLNRQPYRLSFWRVAGEEITYRRFFDINDMAAIRVEVPGVFAHSHQVVLELLAEGKASGVRVDHPDGLWDPRAYLEQLQRSYLSARVRHELHGSDAGEVATAEELERALDPWWDATRNGKRDPEGTYPLYVVVEKILSEGEPLPEDWPVHGTTGYDFLNLVNGLFVDATGRRDFDRLYRQFSGTDVDFRNLTNSTRKMIMLISLASEINMLSHQLEGIAERNRWYRDFTLNSLTFAIREVIAALPVYRTYLTESGAPARRDEAHVEAAVAEAKRRNPRTAHTIFDFVRDTLLLRNLADFPAEDHATLIAFAMKVQQVTGPVMAKGIEDTAFYVYNRLASLNEVGGNPAQFGTSVHEFHRQNAERLRRWPHAMLATSTHDTKRSEDVRARIDVLSELPGEWQAAVRRWARLNARKKSRVDGARAPDRNDEYLLYQTLLGAWLSDQPAAAVAPEFVDRIASYMLKATKEAKVHTSWVNPNADYDQAVQDFVRRILSDDDDGFLDDLNAFQRRIAEGGRWNSLAQTLLKLTVPGVPDVYQGTELWDLSLVDPDNRRPVDYAPRRTALRELRKRAGRANRLHLVDDLVASAEDGRIKLYVMAQTLAFRREHRELFARGSYVALDSYGERREHVCAFARALGEERVLVVAPRLVAGLTDFTRAAPLGEVWGDTWLALPRGHDGRAYRNLLTEERLEAEPRGDASSLPLARICHHFPVAILEEAAA